MINSSIDECSDGCAISLCQRIPTKHILKNIIPEIANGIPVCLQCFNNHREQDRIIRDCYQSIKRDLKCPLTKSWNRKMLYEVDTLANWNSLKFTISIKMVDLHKNFSKLLADDDYDMEYMLHLSLAILAIDENLKSLN